MRIVLDTNVLVRALLTPPNPSRELLEIALRGEGHGVTVLYDGRILKEYREVLQRPKFGFDAKRALKVVRRLQLVGVSVRAAAIVGLKLPDPNDVSFIEVAESGNAAVVVTFNPKHFPKTRGFMVADAGSVLAALRALGSIP